MPAPNLAPILAPAHKAPNPFGHDRETGADGFALLLAFLAGAPAASGDATASPSTAGAAALVASRPVDPAALPGGVGSTVAGELAAGRSGFAKLDLGRPDLDGAASAGQSGTAAAGDPSGPASAFQAGGSALSGPARLPSGTSAGLPSSSPVSSSPTPAAMHPLPLATGPLPHLAATVAGERVARPGHASVRNLGPFDHPLTGAEGPASAIEPLAAAEGTTAAPSPSGSPAPGPAPFGETAGPAAGPSGSLLDVGGVLARSAAAPSVSTFVANGPFPPIGPSLEPAFTVTPAGTASSLPANAASHTSFGPGSSTAPGVDALSEPTFEVASRASHSRAFDTNQGAVTFSARSPADPADRSATGRPGPRVSQAVIEGASFAAGQRRAGALATVATASNDADTATGTVPRTATGSEGEPVAEAVAFGSGPSAAPGDPPASRSMPGGPLQGAPPAPGEAGAVGLPPRSAGLAPAGGGGPEATDPQPLGVAGPAGSPGERVAAAGSSKVASSGERTSGGSAEAGVGGGSESSADPASSLDLAEAGSVPVLDPRSLPEPAPTGRTAEPPVPPRLSSVPVPQPPAVQVAATLLQRDGVPIERLRIALEPAELGSVELTLTSESRRKARAIVLVERPETLELLQRDQRTLERILVASGLELEGGGLELGLRRDGEGRREAFASPSSGAGPSEAVRSGPAVTPPRLLDLRLLDLVV